MKLKLMAVFLFCLTALKAFSININNVIAYPVPFNPRSGVMTIGFDPLYPDSTSYNVKIEIFDINGDLVIEKTGKKFPVKWNGRNVSGKYVKPGMYIIKVSAETEDGDYGKKNIRVLVNY